MKNKKVLILLLGCFVILVGVYFVTNYISEKINYVEPETTVDTSVSIFNIAVDDISEVRVLNSYGDNTFCKDTEGAWTVKGDEEATIAQSIVRRMAINAGGLTAVSKVEDTCDNLTKYALDNPQYTITVRQYDGTESTFYIGMQNQVTTEFYVYAEGVDGIYAVDSTFPGYFNFDIRELYYFQDIINTSETRYWRELAASYEDNSWKLVRMNDGSEYDVSGMRAWYMVDLYEHEVAIDTTLLEAIQNAFLELTMFSCETFDATDEELEEAGLTPGNCKGSLYYYFEEALVTEEVTENTVVGSEKIWLGNKTEDGMYYYVQPDGRKGIFTIDAEIIDKILANSAENLLQKYISVINISTIESISVEMGDISYESTVQSVTTDAGEEYSHYHNGKMLEKESASNFYTALIGIYAEKALLQKEEPSGKELLKITFKRNTEKIPVYEVTFYEYSVNYYKVAINGEVCYLANARDYKALVETITAFMENITYAE